MVKDTCNTDENVAPARKKKTRRKVILLSNKNVVLAGKKKIQGKEKIRLRKKMRLREKRRCTKKSLSMVGLETDKTKSNNEKGLGFKVLNVNSVIKPTFRLSNTSCKAELGSGNKNGEESGNELIIMIYNILIGLFCVFSCLSTSLEIINSVTLKLTDVYLSVNFETI